MNDSAKLILGIFTVFILLIGVNILDVALGFALLPWHSVTAQVQSGHEIIDKTYEADNAIYNYEWFKTQYTDIQASEHKIENTKEMMKSYEETPEGINSTAYKQLQTTYLGQKSYYEDLVSEYNARSQMANRNIFKDGLPANVDNVLERTVI